MSARDAFASLTEARAYLDKLGGELGSLGAAELIAAIERLTKAYGEFPELALDRPRHRLAAELMRAAERLVDRGAVMARIADFDPSAEADPGPDNLDSLLSTGVSGIDRGVLEAAGWSARERLGPISAGRGNRGRVDALLELARRLGAPAPRHRPTEQRDPVRWNGSLSFDEFRLHVPCEIELPADLPDRDFVEAIYSAILLRKPENAETAQCLGLLQQGNISRVKVIEELLGSAELRALERRLRVRFGTAVITDPERPEARDMPVSTWPWRSAG